MKRTLLFIACVLASLTMSAQESYTDYFDYLPFVQEGKRWNVFRSDADFDPCCYLEQYMLINEGIEKNGKTYMNMKLYRSEDDMTAVYDSGLFREENRKVYIFDTDMQKEFLMFDYSLKVGDTYETYSYDEQKMVSYKIISVDDYTEGPEIARYVQEADSMATHLRYLRKWIVSRTDNESFQKTWIESVGSLEGPLGNLHDIVLPDFTKDYLGYVEYVDDYAFVYPYLPFSFYDTLNRQVHGCNLPKSNASQLENQDYQLTYELEGDRLHVYGKVALNCGPANYAYFIEKPTDDPLVHKLHFEIQDVEPLATCYSLFETDFYVPGFDPNMDYIVVNNNGEEHPVINRTPHNEYRPFIEDGKVWKVGALNSGNPVQLAEYFYFDGDTIIDGRACKRMMRQQYVCQDYEYYDLISPQYVGAWYEESQKVYFYDASTKQLGPRCEMMYDFSANTNDTLMIGTDFYVIGPRLIGGISGFKGAYRNVMMCKDGDSIVHSTPWLEGVGGVYGPTMNVIDGELADPEWFLMSCTVGDEVIYLNNVYKDGTTPESAEARKRFDFTHTIKTQPKAPRKWTRARSTSPADEGQTLYGEYNNLLLDINLTPLDDAYLVRITDETGKVAYEKTVNAASIVSLNIDISAYAAGRYTVTVDNSLESFTGIFETRTSGISDVTRLNNNEETINKNAYNLQGQRINSLQKGLYIVNGRKLYVK